MLHEPLAPDEFENKVEIGFEKMNDTKLVDSRTARALDEHGIDGHLPS